MRLLANMAMFAVLAAIRAPGQSVVDESPTPYDIVVAASVTVLPSPLEEFFTAHLEMLREHAAPGNESSPAARSVSGGSDWHYVMLDVAAGSADAGARRLAARAFPREQEEAAKLFREHDRDRGGVLPWVLCERRACLGRAFRAGEKDAVLREAGAILHLATDGSLPFNTTADRDGAASGSLLWSREKSATNADLQSRTVRHRYQNVFIARFRDRLAFEVRVAPVRYSPGPDCASEVFDALLAAHGTIEELARIDAQATRALGIVDAATFAARADEYYAILAERAGPAIELRLEAAALLGANLIGAAWSEAGSPALGERVSPGAPEAGKSHSSAEVQEPYVGSRESTVFHRATCKHVERIKPRKRVYFSSVKEALDAGRKPCRACRPGGS